MQDCLVNKKVRLYYASEQGLCPKNNHPPDIRVDDYFNFTKRPRCPFRRSANNFLLP